MINHPTFNHQRPLEWPPSLALVVLSHPARQHNRLLPNPGVRQHGGIKPSPTRVAIQDIDSEDPRLLDQNPSVSTVIHVGTNNLRKKLSETPQEDFTNLIDNLLVRLSSSLPALETSNSAMSINFTHGCRGTAARSAYLCRQLWYLLKLPISL